MAGPATFLLVFFALSLTGAIVAVVLRARNLRDRWAGCQSLAAARGLQAVDGDPLGLGPVFSGSGTGATRVVKRTLSGIVDGIPVAVILTVGRPVRPFSTAARGPEESSLDSPQRLCWNQCSKPGSDRPIGE